VATSSVRRPAAKVEATAAAASLPVVEEQVVVAKRRRVTGAVRVATRTREEERLVDEPYDVEEVEVQRVPVEGDRWVDAPVPDRQEGDTTIVSIHEEVVVVETRLRVVEEVRLTRRRATRRHTERVTVRREEALVERLDPSGEGGGGGGGGEPG
jgi:stress response protein YsnF